MSKKQKLVIKKRSGSVTKLLSPNEVLQEHDRFERLLLKVMAADRLGVDTDEIYMRVVDNLEDIEDACSRANIVIDTSMVI